MTKLGAIRGQLSSLRRWRLLVRRATAYSALLTAVLWALAALFAIDYFFFSVFSTALDVVQRVILLAIAGCCVFAAYYFLSRPLMLVTESDLDVALLVEKNQGINSDLVAAIQFESPEAATWGSRQLETAVIDYVAQIGRALNVFEGFSREQILRRGAILLATVFVLGGLCALFPNYASAFFNRLAMSSRHYPTRTVIEHVIVNTHPALERSGHESRPARVKCAQGQPVSFTIQCSGDLPGEGEIALRTIGGSGGRRMNVELKRLSLDERLSRLKQAAGEIARSQQQGAAKIDAAWTERVADLVRLDAPQAVLPIQSAERDAAKLNEAATAIDKVATNWPGSAGRTAVYVGELGRLLDPVAYNIYLGDAWTDSAMIEMIPLPVVETWLKAIPPKYARNGKEQVAEPSARQISVLEGSEVEVAIECKNKELTEAWLVTKEATDPQKFALARQGSDGRRWELKKGQAPFARVLAETRFAVQVTDVDGLHLETPIDCIVRLKADRPPRGSAGIVHRVVLPGARPILEYDVTDDYGIAKIRLHTQVERSQDNVSASDGDVERTEEKHSYEIADEGMPLRADRLPLRSQYQFDLSPLKLVKGDRLRLELEIVDYRGDQPGESYLSDPLVLEVSDESGVLAAISEADERSEKRLTDIIKQQLGIGESP